MLAGSMCPVRVSRPEITVHSAMPHLFRRGWLAAVLLMLATTGVCARPVGEAPPSLVYAVHVPPGGSGGRPLYVALHGLGSDEQDLLGLAPLLPHDAVLASLRAPYALAPGHYAWFTPRRAGDRLDGDPAQIEASEQAVLHTVDALIARYQIDPRRIVLFGFSQGAIMSYDLALAAPQRFRSIGILSGAFFDSVRQRLDPHGAKLSTRVFIGHGLADPRIPSGYAREAADWWRERGAQVQLHLYPGMQHQVGDQELNDFSQWLQQQ